MNMSVYRETDGVQTALSWVADLGTAEAFLKIKVDEVRHGVTVDDMLFSKPTD